MKKLALLVLPFFFTGCVYYTDTLAYNDRGYYNYGYYVPNYGYNPYYNSYNYYVPQYSYNSYDKKDWHEHGHHHGKRDDWNHHR